MKNLIGLIVVMGLIFTGLYFFNQWKTREYNWTPTYSRHDKEPFGSYAFDDVLEQSWKKPYNHTYKGIAQLLDDKELTDQSLLIVSESFNPFEDELEGLLNYVKSGHQVMIAAEYFGRRLSDTLRFDFGLNYEDYPNIPSYTTKDIKKNKDSLRFLAPSLNNQIYEFPKINICFFFNEIKNPDFIVIAQNNDSFPALMRLPIGKGNLLLSSTPRIFTNYGILDKTNNEFLMRALAYLDGAPLIRTEHYGAGTDESQSIFRYLESQPPLRWALYLTMATCLLFMIFTAKRKQKAIPVIKDPENRLIGFVRSMAELYLRKNNNADIVLKKYRYWAENIRKEHGLDVINNRHDSEFLKTLSAKTGRQEVEISRLFQKLDAIKENSSVTDSNMMELIEKLKL